MLSAKTVFHPLTITCVLSLQSLNVQFTVHFSLYFWQAYDELSGSLKSLDANRITFPSARHRRARLYLWAFSGVGLSSTRIYIGRVWCTKIITVDEQRYASTCGVDTLDAATGKARYVFVKFKSAADTAQFKNDVIR